jgi:serine/threonine protein kinase
MSLMNPLNESTSSEGVSFQPHLKTFEELDQKIQAKTQGVFYRTLGAGQKEVNADRAKRLALAGDLIKAAPENKETLKKVSEVNRQELMRMYGSYGNEAHIDSHESLQREVDTLQKQVDVRLRETKTSVVDYAEVKEGVGSDKSLNDNSFRKRFNNPNTIFCLPIGEEGIELQGGGVNDQQELEYAGAYGRVFLGESVACKVMNMVDVQVEREAINEANFLCKMEGSQHVMGSSKVINIESKGRRTVEYSCILMKKMDGDLKAIAKKSPSYDKEVAKQKVGVLRDAAAGLQELHKEGIVHQDVKTENVLFNKSENKAYIADLGSCEYESLTKGKTVGTPAYRSPEGDDRQRQTTASDIYSFGVMAHEVITGELLRLGDDKYQDYQVDRTAYKEELGGSAGAKMAKLVDSCLKCDPTDRITSTKLEIELSAMLKKL